MALLGTLAHFLISFSQQLSNKRYNLDEEIQRPER